MTRYALIRKTLASTNIEPYLPSNYRIILDQGRHVVIEGVDDAGWTLDDYVLPRLASGLNFGEEIDRDHPILAALPKTAATLMLDGMAFTVATQIVAGESRVTITGKDCQVQLGDADPVYSVVVKLVKLG